MIFDNPNANPFRRYASRPDVKFLDALISSVNRSKVDAIDFPRFPPPALQQRMHGHSNETSLREAFHFARVCRRFADQVRGGIKPGDRMLDFGCGWGRIMRLFMPYFDLDKIVGYEPNEEFARVARELTPYMAIIEGPPAPPSIFGAETFDLVVSWSVFSHLPEDLARRWLEEFARITRPGAVLCLSTWGSRFLDWLDADAAKLARGEEVHWYRKDVLGRIGDVGAARAKFAAGEFVWVHGSKTYGEALIPEAAMRKLVPPDLEVAAMETEQAAQTVFILRRRATESPS